MEDMMHFRLSPGFGLSCMKQICRISYIFYCGNIDTFACCKILSSPISYDLERAILGQNQATPTIGLFFHAKTTKKLRLLSSPYRGSTSKRNFISRLSSFIVGKSPSPS